MELNFDPVTTPLRSAATVVMLRDGDTGVEVLLLKRHGLSDVLGGAHVFPGGKVDARDALDGDIHLDQAATELLASLGEAELQASDATSLYVAAVREAFEESDVLFAHGVTSAQVTHARELLRTGHRFDSVLEKMALRLQTRNLLPWARWITPIMPSVSRKRFDTRFFVARFPAGQTAQHDNHEATESVWLGPRHALQRYWQREMELAPPQIMTLAHLSHYASVDEVLRAARSRRPPVVMPEPFQHEGARVVTYPGDERHTMSARALPGPTRLTYRDGRFEPSDGFDAFFTPPPDTFAAP